MSLSEGTRLGTYEITGRIGAGGMGEVFRATDTKLGRDVAIKTLPTALASDKDRLARFEREAKLLAALNHAHIASVYSLDEHEGTLYLAMELVEGETLEEKLKPGAMPVEDALRLALQIAEALEAAHAKGVVHRDLKPANIMVTPDGVVKVLDFGLAKAFSNEPEEASPGRSPALSLAMTQQGIILGTAGYMSPEQASGQATDQRADIWAFGVVLYEMLTGLPLFSGESVPHILADVLRMEPDWSRLPKNLHPRLRQLLERCLAKKPRNRYAGIADARVDIEQVLSDPAGTTPEPVAAGELRAASKSRRIGLPLAAVFTGAAVAGLAVWFAVRPAPPASLPVNSFDYDIPADVAFRRAGRPVLALSPDGRNIAINSSDGILLRRMSELEATPIPGTNEDLSSPFFSPDGQSIAYYTFAGSQLKRISIGGGAPVVVAPGIDNPIGASWAADGTILLGQEAGIARVSANGGTAETVIPAEEGERLHGPQLLPDGDSVLFTAVQRGDVDEAEIVVASIATGDRTVVLHGGSDARYLATGHLVYAYQDDLIGMAFDPETLEVSGAPVNLVQGLSIAAGAGTNTPAANYGISDDGTLVYLAGAPFRGSFSGGRTLVWVDRDGNETEVGMGPCNCADNGLALAPDGTRAAVAIFDADGGDIDIYVWSFAAETLTRLTFEAGNQDRPVWTSDSRRIIYASAGEGIMARAADGTGTVETLLAESSAAIEPWSLDANGNVLFGMNNDIYVLDVSGDGEASALLADEVNEGEPMISPDGHWIAYAARTGLPEVYVRSYPDMSGMWQVSSGGGVDPRWSVDGRRLYFVGALSGGSIALMQTDVTTEPSFSRQTPAALFSYQTYSGYDVGSDGESFLVIRNGLGNNLPSAQQARVIIIENWIEKLKELVPTG